jgi:hypothetical protein
LKKKLQNSLGNCTIAGIAQFPLTYTLSYFQHTSVEKKQ